MRRAYDWSVRLYALTLIITGALLMGQTLRSNE